MPLALGVEFFDLPRLVKYRDKMREILFPQDSSLEKERIKKPRKAGLGLFSTCLFLLRVLNNFLQLQNGVHFIPLYHNPLWIHVKIVRIVGL